MNYIICIIIILLIILVVICLSMYIDKPNKISKMSKVYDHVIIGAGISGITTAYELKRAHTHNQKY